jgi:methionyl-tRNA synthetase
VVRANELIERVKPWALAKDPERHGELATTMNALLETLRLVAAWAWPVMPAKMEELWAMLALAGKPGEVRGDAGRPSFGDPSFAGRTLGESRILFPRIEIKADAAQTS